MNNTRRGIDVGVRHTQVHSDFTRVPNHILENPDFTGNEIRVYLLIFKNKANFKISRSWLSKKTGLSEKTISKILANLEKKKVLKRTRKPEYNEYVFELFDFPEASDN